MKKIIRGMLTAVMIGVIAITAQIIASADGTYDVTRKGETYTLPTADVYVDGKKVNTDAPAVIIEGHTCIPLRAVSEAMGCRVTWDDKNKEARIEMGSVSANSIAVTVGINKEQMNQRLYTADNIIKNTIQLGMYAFIDENTNRTYIPLRAVSEALFAKVDWVPGRVDIERKFTGIDGEFTTDGVVRVIKDDKVGLMNTAGELIAPLIYDDVFYFCEGRAIVKKDGKYGFIDTTGKVVVPIIYDMVSDFSEGRAKVRRNYEYGFIDATGELVVPTIYEWATDFYNGEAVATRQGELALIDKEGDAVREVRYNYLYDYDGVFSFSPGILGVEFDGKYGLIDWYGSVVAPPIYDTIKDISEGMAGVLKDGKYGFIDTKGNVAIPIIYDYEPNYRSEFHDGLANVGKNGKWGYIDMKGNVVIPFIYDHAWEFSNGLAQVQLNQKCGLVNKSGDVVLPIEYDYILEYTNSYAKVRVGSEYLYVDF